MRKWTVVVAVGVLSLSVVSNASAQARRRAYAQEQQYEQGGYSQGQPRTAGRYDASQRATGPMQAVNSTDQQLASWLLVDNRGEIQLARLAQERATCDEVKDFAKHMIDDHAEMVEKLQRFAGAGRGTQQAGQYGQQATGQYGQQAGGQLNFVRLKQQLGQQCVASAQQELEKKDAEEFDKCYIGIQIAKHMEMLDTLKVFSRYASPQLDQVIEEAEQTTEEHLEKAKQLIKDHEGKEGKGKSSTSSDNDKSSSSRDRSSTSKESGRDRNSDNDRE